MIKGSKSLKKEGLEFLEWSKLHPVGNIPKLVAKEGAGENRIPFAHLANSVPVYLIFKHFLKQHKKRSAKILDIGCGTGRNISFVSETLGKNNYIFHGIDYSTDCIEYAKNQYKNQGVLFKAYSGKKLPFKDNSFDFVVSSHVLEHVKKEYSLLYLSEISRVLKKSGISVIGTPNRKYCQDLFYKNSTDEKKYRLVLPHEHEYYLEELKEVFNQSKKIFTKSIIYQTINPINRDLMTKAINKIKPQPGLIGLLKFQTYLYLRSASKLQDLMAKIGTEYLLRTMKVSYKELMESTTYIETPKDIGDNLIVVAKK